MSDIRARLRQTKQSGAQSPTQNSNAFDFRSPPQTQFRRPGEELSISEKMNETVERLKGPALHLHLYWHIYAVGVVFLLFHCVSLFPTYFPGMENTKSPYAYGVPLIAFAFLTLPSVATFFILRKFRRGLQQAARISEIKNWSRLELIGAAIGFAVMFYIAFFYLGIMDRNMAPEFIKAPFDLTPREWIMAGVKCVGGAVAGAMLTRKLMHGVS